MNKDWLEKQLVDANEELGSVLRKARDLEAMIKKLSNRYYSLMVYVQAGKHNESDL